MTTTAPNEHTILKPGLGFMIGIAVAVVPSSSAIVMVESPLILYVDRYVFSTTDAISKE